MSEQPRDDSFEEELANLRAQVKPQEPTPEELAEGIARLTAAVESLTEVIKNLQFQKLGDYVLFQHVEKGEPIATTQAPHTGERNRHHVDPWDID